jgi:diaminohydroxyphosphoribosylaminopyrimidine deaminase/5-amino-6-(5-phosphoribosylamino)uracil reductase
MKRALALARQGEGLTRPNPPVGALVVKSRRLVGEGFHQRAGGPHAERVALAAAGSAAKNGTLYVTLEPCSTYGRTPPCTEAIIESGIQCVVAAVADPNPKHAGQGFEVLRKAGVDVVTGVAETEARELIAPFANHITTGLPYCTLKLAQTIDGRIADSKRRSQWISGPDSRSEVHRLRCRVDGIMVGGATVKADNPQLIPRPSEGRKPRRIIVDPDGDAPMTAKVFNDRYKRRTIYVSSRVVLAKRQKRLEAAGVECMDCPGRQGRPDMQKVMKRLGGMGLLHILCEGGGVLAGALVRDACVNEFVWFIAPSLLGGDSVPSLGGKGWLMERKPRLRWLEQRMVGNDLLIRAAPVRTI